MALAGVSGMALAGVIGFVLAGGLDERATVRVSGDGIRVVRVALVDRAVGFDVTPDVIEVDAGTHVVVEVVNEAGGPHDLAVDGGPRTARLAPGKTGRLDSAGSAPGTRPGARSATTASPVRPSPSGLCEPSAAGEDPDRIAGRGAGVAGQLPCPSPRRRGPWDTSSPCRKAAP